MSASFYLPCQYHSALIERRELLPRNQAFLLLEIYCRSLLHEGSVCIKVTEVIPAKLVEKTAECMNAYLRKCAGKRLQKLTVLRSNSDKDMIADLNFKLMN